MGRVHYRPVPLDEVVAAASEIVVVEGREPSFRLESFPLEGLSVDGEPAPPFGLRVDQWRVKEVLHGNLAVGAEIDVWPANWRNEKRLHEEYYSIGLSRSYMRDVYECQSPDDEEMILFLVAAVELSYVVPGAAEGASHRAEIEALVAGAPPQSW